MATAVPQHVEKYLIVSHRGEPTWEIARSWPHQGEWTEEDYLSIRDRLEGPVELSDGCLEFLPMPDFIHQFIFEFLFDTLRDHLKRSHTSGRVLSAPFPIRLIEGKFREPDVIFLRPERIQDFRRQPDGADLVVEIVSRSPKDRQRDFEKKRAEYAQAGITEYWIVDPETRTIHVLTLDGVEPGGPYRVHGEFKTGETATSLLLEGFHVSVDDVFAAGEGKATDSPSAS